MRVTIVTLKAAMVVKSDNRRHSGLVFCQKGARERRNAHPDISRSHRPPDTPAWKELKACLVYARFCTSTKVASKFRLGCRKNAKLELVTDSPATPLVRANQMVNA